MSEQPPINEEKPTESEEEKIRRERELEREQNDAGFKLVEKDKADPERGPIVRLVRAVYKAAYKDLLTHGPLFGEFDLFRKSFVEHFGLTEATRHRLYHIIIGSGPLEKSDLFDAEGEWSVAENMRKLALKYHIDY